MTSFSEEYQQTQTQAQARHAAIVRTVGLGHEQLPQGQFFEPLLLADGGDSALRHAQRYAYAGGVGGGAGGSPSHDVSYDLNNSNYAINGVMGDGAGVMYSGDVNMIPEAGYDGYDDGIGSTPSALRAHPPFPSLPADLLLGARSSNSVLLSPTSQFVYAVSPTRWWVLAVFCYLSFLQSLIWITYSPVTSKAEEYYGVSEGAVDLLLTWGPIVNMVVLPLVSHMARTAQGMRHLIFATAWLELLACLIRLVPEVSGPHSSLHSHAVYFLHAGHILNAAAGPIMEATITKMSCLWFAPSERTAATSVLWVSNSLGSALGFIIGPGMVHQPEYMPRYLLLQLCMTALGFLSVFPLLPRFFFPARPTFFPSKAAAEMEQAGQNQGQGHLGGAGGGAGGGSEGSAVNGGYGGMWGGIKAAWTNPAFVLIALSTGILGGAYGCWTSILSTVLPHYSDRSVGWLSFASTVAGCVSGVLIGPLASRPSTRRKTKLLIGVCMGLSSLCALAFLLLTPSVFRESDPLIPNNLALMFVCISLMGAFIGAATPLCYELCVELLYPHCIESVSSGILTFNNNVAAFVFLGVAPRVSGKVMTLLMFLTAVLATGMIVPVRDEYRRMDHEEQAAAAEAEAEAGDAATRHEDGYGDSISRDSSYGVSLRQRQYSLAAHEDDLQQEFVRVMHAVDDDMSSSPPSTSPTHGLGL